MGNENFELPVEAEWQCHPEAKKLFGELDFQLKDGMHFQLMDGQYGFFRFLEENERSLRTYYHHYFGMSLCCSGEGMLRYYFLDFNDAGKAKVDYEHRDLIKNEYIIIGFLVYKIIFIDQNIELSSISLLQDTIRKDYEEMKTDLYRLIAKAKKQNATTMNDRIMDDTILKALKEFNKIGWVSLDEDTFDPNPSFHRIHSIYGEYIKDIDNLIKIYPNND
ncbi:hypothetical protein DVR12_22600 [Chitinophaga silvatica]|uniref:Uncharacterized protein n=1 Tax=Chitinophaga silvatica TaxID=2282649 RepID=A0A3E1Y423_9BACT|nr:hypothetical protein [Chitinophaga silvatica]RFS19428.1 hypothetical protein DVR12_22600 [Chitinophaga silvatica]